MKKTALKKQTKKNVAPRGVAVKTAERSNDTGWSLSIYVYWFIILFFIAATFYILGTHQGAKSHKNIDITISTPTQPSEEALLQSNDYYIKGRTELFAGDIEKAVIDLTTAIESDKNNVDAYILRGEAYMQNGNYSDAMTDFNTALELDNKNSIAYYDRSLLNARTEDYSAAMSDINNALAAFASNPNDVLQERDLYAKRGQLNLRMKNWEGAIADYKNSLARPEGIVTPSVYAERAEAYTALGEYQSAINDYTSAIRVISEQIQGATTPEQKEDLAGYAMSYYENSAALNLIIGNTAAARSDLNAAIELASSLNDTETVDRLQSWVSETK
ncbi:MAG: tetratricopeptide repeat protein [Alphaproteobacteria bacterium]|nr:tetratricopeptide repeat protein [Alphaproteobacteria bacterium]